jgi:NAD(P)-dependent dehydrogenase (short-subunit alcohol dehydrogenase family)
MLLGKQLFPLIMSQKSEKQLQPPQHQKRRPGIQSAMTPQPKSDKKSHSGSGKLQDKVAIITGGDSGIGRAIAILFAKEGADVVIGYLNEHNDAKQTRKLVEQYGRRCEPVAGDIGQEWVCKELVETAIRKFGKVDIVVNNASEQHPQKSITDISEEQLERTFRTNVFSYFFLVKAALPHLSEGGVILNTASVTAYKGSPELLDYSATKGAEIAFTRSLSQALADKKIRVNAVAPGPIWTPLIPSTFPKEKVATFGGNVPLGRPGQPDEVATAYLFLASDDASYITGQTIHPNGGTVING